MTCNDLAEAEDHRRINVSQVLVGILGCCGVSSVVLSDGCGCLSCFFCSCWALALSYAALNLVSELSRRNQGIAGDRQRSEQRELSKLYYSVLCCCSRESGVSRGGRYMIARLSG
jgi:hypothetical protein